MTPDPRQTTRLCLPIEAWPAPDRDAWAAAHRRGGLLDDDGAAAGWAPATSTIIARGFGRFLSFLAGAEDLNCDEPPGARITRSRVESYIEDLRRSNHSSTIAARIRELGRAAAVMTPAKDCAWLRRLSARLRRSATPKRDDRARLVPADRVVELGFELMRQAEQDPGLAPFRRALLFRDGLLLCVLSACPLRARNIAALAIGTSLAKRGADWWVAFEPGETKNGRPIEMPLPAALTWAIEMYLQRHRPELVGRSAEPVAAAALWVSDGGRPLTAKGIGYVVSEVTRRQLGRSLNPHLFRKMAATELAIRDPEHVGIAQPLLGHADYRTTQQAYNLGRAIDAAGQHQALIQSVRGVEPQSAKRCPGGRRARRPN